MNQRSALKVLYVLLGLLSVLHLLILLKFIPYDQVWGGRLTSVEEMYRFEGVALGLSLFMLLIFYLKSRNLQSGKRNKLVNFLIWLFFGYFILNTIGNLMAESIIELIVGSLVSLGAAFLSYKVVME